MTQTLIALQLLLTDRLDALRTTRDDRGATAVEYGLMVALIAAVIILAVTALGDELVAIFEEVTDAIQGA